DNQEKPDTNNNGQAKPTTPEQNGQLGAGVKPGTANPDQNTEVTTPNENGNPKPGTVTPDQNNEPTGAQTGGDKGGQTGGDTGRNTGEDKGGQTGGDTGNTDSDNKQTVVNDEVKTSNGSKDKSELPETGLSNESDYATTVFGTLSLAASLLLLRRQRKESK
ncbi:LPXTG cell wall anchor domain-containing protein, partial [Staphylococcus capitis]